MITRWTRLLIAMLSVGLLCLPQSAEAVRIKDIGAIEGVRENQLIG